MIKKSLEGHEKKNCKKFKNIKIMDLQLNELKLDEV